jgi:hypothetical protein
MSFFSFLYNKYRIIKYFLQVNFNSTIPIKIIWRINKIEKRPEGDEEETGVPKRIRFDSNGNIEKAYLSHPFTEKPLLKPLKNYFKRLKSPK